MAELGVSTLPIVVEKYGTTSVTRRDGQIDYERIESYTKQIAVRRNRYNTIVVASGSVAAGAASWSPNDQRELDIPKRLLATQGSVLAASAWFWAGAGDNLKISQILVSHRDLADPDAASLFREILMESLAFGVTPVCNENDAVSDEEMKALVYGGDNDGVASLIAQFVGAKYLLLRTDVEGILKNGQCIPKVTSNNVQEVYDMLGIDFSEPQPSNSMQSKLVAAHRASEAGVRSYICHSEAMFGHVVQGRSGTFVDLPAAG